MKPLRSRAHKISSSLSKYAVFELDTRKTYWSRLKHNIAKQHDEGIEKKKLTNGDEKPTDEKEVYN